LQTAAAKRKLLSSQDVPEVQHPAAAAAAAEPEAAPAVEPTGPLDEEQCKRAKVVLERLSAAELQKFLRPHSPSQAPVRRSLFL